jgi:hypothetical protein
MRLSAADCLRRGFTNLSANWELVLIQWLQSVLLLALLAASLALPLVILGGDALLAGSSVERALAAAWARLGRLSTPGLLPAAVAMLALWLLSLLVHCWIQAGTYGVLASADRQALPGAHRDRQLFRTFSPRDFSGWGALYLGRYFRILLLFWLLALPLACVALLWLFSTAVGGSAWGRGAALGIGCCGALPVGFLMLVLGLWINVSQADLAREGSSVRAASRRSLSVLGRRLGAVAALVLLIAAAAFVVGLVFIPVSAVPETLLGSAPRWRALVRVVLFLLQGLPSTLLAMILAASLVALVRSEGLREIRREPEVQTA